MCFVGRLWSPFLAVGFKVSASSGGPAENPENDLVSGRGDDEGVFGQTMFPRRRGIAVARPVRRRREACSLGYVDKPSPNRRVESFANPSPNRAHAAGKSIRMRG